MNSGYSEPPDIVNFLPGPLEFTIMRVYCNRILVIDMTIKLGPSSLIRVSVDTLYRDGANDVSRERIQTAPLAHPGRAS